MGFDRTPGPGPTGQTYLRKITCFVYIRPNMYAVRWSDTECCMEVYNKITRYVIGRHRSFYASIRQRDALNRYVLSSEKRIVAAASP